jgi:hypothetical protein
MEDCEQKSRETQIFDLREKLLDLLPRLGPATCAALVNLAVAVQGEDSLDAQVVRGVKAQYLTGSDAGMRAALALILGFEGEPCVIGRKRFFPFLMEELVFIPAEESGDPELAAAAKTLRAAFMDGQQQTRPPLQLVKRGKEDF